MVRQVEDGAPCADDGCSGVFRASDEPRDGGGGLGPPAKLVLLLAVASALFKVVMALLAPPLR